MEMKRALFWYLVIVVVMAGGLYLVLELFVNNPESAGPGGSEGVALEDDGPQAGTPVAGTLAGITEEEIIPGSSPGAPAGSTSTGSPSATPGGTETGQVPAQSGTAPAASSTTAEVSGNYTVQVAALASLDKAAGMVEKLHNDGFPEGRIGRDMGDSLHRIWVGSFSTKAEAALMAERLKGKGYNTYVRAVQ
jgi:cell division septation protein DedD